MTMDIFDSVWLLEQPLEYQRAVWTGRAKTRIAFAEQAETPREEQANLHAAGIYERNALSCMDYEGKEDD